MTPEQMEKAIEFILNQQAKNEQEIAQLTANVNKISKEMRTGWAETRGAIDALTEAMLDTKRLAEQVAELNIPSSNGFCV